MIVWLMPPPAQASGSKNSSSEAKAVASDQEIDAKVVGDKDGAEKR